MTLNSISDRTEIIRTELDEQLEKREEKAQGSCGNYVWQHNGVDIDMNELAKTKNDQGKDFNSWQKCTKPTYYESPIVQTWTFLFKTNY